MSLYVDGYNQFSLFSTPNQFSMNFLNPFHPMVTMVVSIEFPVLPDPDSADEEWATIPQFTLNDFLGYGQPFESLLEDENSFLYNAFLLYRALAINNIQYGNVKDEVNWKYLVAMYIGHYMDIHVENLKDIDNRYSLNQSPREQRYKVEDLKMLNENEFMQTSYGRLFWSKYSIIGNLVFKGYRTQRGRY